MNKEKCRKVALDDFDWNDVVYDGHGFVILRGGDRVDVVQSTDGMDEVKARLNYKYIRGSKSFNDYGAIKADILEMIRVGELKASDYEAAVKLAAEWLKI